MPDKHITAQECQYSGPLCEVAKGLDDLLCGGSTSSFFAVLLCIAIGLSLLTAWTAYVAGGAEDVVYRRAAEIKAASYVHAGWER